MYYYKSCKLSANKCAQISIYYVRDDGSKYSLAQGSEAYCLGEMALFEEDNTTVFAQAVTDVICLAFLIAGNEEKLLASNQFLLLICKNIAGKLSAAMMRDAVSSSISERVRENRLSIALL